jgi:queuine tRNA-ribosyltransferase
MMRMLAHVAPRLPAHAPRYLMGVGTPEDLVEAWPRRRHVRLRDAHAQRAQRLAVHPLRRRASLATRAPRRRAPPLDATAAATPAATSRAPTCTTCSAVDEILGARLATIHNLHYYLD